MASKNTCLILRFKIKTYFDQSFTFQINFHFVLFKELVAKRFQWSNIYDTKIFCFKSYIYTRIILLYGYPRRCPWWWFWRHLYTLFEMHCPSIHLSLPTQSKSTLQGGKTNLSQMSPVHWLPGGQFKLLIHLLGMQYPK